MADLPAELAALLAAPDLGKWPRLLVAGDRITEERANEVILRTTDWWLTANDRPWIAAVAREVGLTVDGHGMVDWRSAAELRDRLGGLALHYLTNHRIVSSWIGGPHGWCGWDGTIRTGNYNLGKWPTAEEVTEDWQVIAAAFPFLNLRAQLVPDEGESPRVAVEWRVADGSVEVCEPAGKLDAGPELSDTQLLSRLFSRGSEQGVSIKRLRAAVAQLT